MTEEQFGRLEKFLMEIIRQLDTLNKKTPWPPAPPKT